MENKINNQKKAKNVFKSNAFLLLFLGTLVSNIGTTLYSFAISFYILEITDNNALIQGIYLAVCGIVFILFSPIGGVLADRWNKVKIIFGSDYIKGFLFIISAIILIFLIKDENVNLQLVILFIGGFVSNMIGAIFSPASTALIPSIVERNQLQQANSYFSILKSFEGILGILLAGILYATLSITTIYFVIGACYIASAISEMFIKAKHEIPMTNLSIKVFFTEIVDGFKYLKTLKGFIALISGILFINFFITPFFGNGMPFFVKDYLAGKPYLFSSFITPELWTSIFSIAESIGSLIMGIIIGSTVQKEKYGKHIKKWLIIMAISFMVTATCFYLFVETNLSINLYLIYLCVFLFFCGIIITNINIPISTVIQREVEPSKLAKVMSFINIGAMGLTPFASLIGGIILNYFGLGPLLIFCSLGFVVTALIISLSKDVNRL